MEQGRISFDQALFTARLAFADALIAAAHADSITLEKAVAYKAQLREIERQIADLHEAIGDLAGKRLS